MGIFQKMVLGGATIAAMSTGQVQAAENSAPIDNPDAAKTETVVTPKDTVINSDNVLDLSNEFLAKQFETQEVITEQYKMQVPGTIEDLKETLSSPTNLNTEQRNAVVLWRNYIISNPQDPVSREAFVALKEATDEVANKWIKIDQYYQSVEKAGTYDELKYSKEALIKNMDAILKHETSEEIRKNIPEANIEYHKGRPPKDYASLRLNNQFLIIDYMEKNPGMIQEYVGLRDSNNEQSKEKAKQIEAMFYKTYGIDINQCNPQNLDNVRNNIIRENKLLDKDFKEQAYMYRLHHSLDRAFSGKESAIHDIDMVYVNDKPFTIDGSVSLAIDGYAKILAKKAKGHKMTKQEKSILYDNKSFPPDMREARDAYFSRCDHQLATLMSKPKGEYVIYVNTNNMTDTEATKYVNLLRLGADYTISGKNQMTDNDRAEITRIEENRPDLKSARIYYESQIAKQKAQQQQQSETYITQNFATQR